MMWAYGQQSHNARYRKLPNARCSALVSASRHRVSIFGNRFSNHREVLTRIPLENERVPQIRTP